MDETTPIPAEEPLQMQDHRCTAVIEVLCAATPDEAWSAVE